MVRQRLVIATLLFLGAFAVIAQLAWNTAESTGGPWFSTSISRDVYSTTLISATILVAILAALAAGLSGLVGRETRALDLRLNILRSSGVVTAVAGGIDIDRDIEDTLDEILGTVGGGPAAPLVTVDREAGDGGEGGRVGPRSETIRRHFGDYRKSELFSPMISCWPFGSRPSAERIVA